MAPLWASVGLLAKRLKAHGGLHGSYGKVKSKWPSKGFCWAAASCCFGSIHHTFDILAYKLEQGQIVICGVHRFF